MTKPSLTSFDQAFVHPGFGYDFDTFMQLQKQMMKEHDQKIMAWIREMEPESKKE